MKLNNIEILGNAKASYTIEWKWEETENDIAIAKEGLAIYRIYIEVYSKAIGNEK